MRQSGALRRHRGRFRQTFVYAAAQVICSCRQELIIRVSAAHRWYASLVAAHQQPTV
jgi:hypothetical protein